MATNLFTSGRTRAKIEDLNKEIANAIRDLKGAFPEQTIEALNWSQNLIAVPLEVEVDRPSRGTVGDIDICEREPIFLLFDRQNYPHVAPSVCYNRMDFPAWKLPHLNSAYSGIPSSFCLHRGSIDNWFAEHSIVDLVHRTSNWLSDASKGHLIRQEDGFEPTRITFKGIYSIFDPKTFSNFIELNWQQNHGKSGFAFLWCKLLKTPLRFASDRIDTYAIQFIEPINKTNLSKFTKAASEINNLFGEQNKIDRRLFGILVWPPENQVCSQFFAEFPRNILELEKWTNELGAPLKDAIQKYVSENLNILGGIPIFIVVKRPQRLIKQDSLLEPISFIIICENKSYNRDGIWSKYTKVETISQRDPLTLKRARYISSRQDKLCQNRLLFLGCGAIGSKLIFHLARCGQNNMTLVDNDTISPHNLIRHALMDGYLGWNKAEAIRNAIMEIFEEDKTIKIDAIQESALNIFLGERKHMLDHHDWIIDTTASPVMLNVLRDASLPRTISCCRCEIADDGRLGILSVEGHKRNPRLDDIQIALFEMATEKKEISRWLQSNKTQSKEDLGSILSEIQIGISCSSETMKLSDDIVSLHAAYFSIGFKESANRKNEKKGQIQISQWSGNRFEMNSSSLPSAVQMFEVLPVTIVQAENDSSWQVRLKNGLEKRLHDAFRQAFPNEIGGLLIGRINQKAKIIYVTDILSAPPDSITSPCAFKMGIEDVPEKIREIDELTGSMLGYVGEWHTHPNGEINMSSVDERTAKMIKKNLDCIPLPTHILIVTKKGLHPYILSKE